ncbi:porin family protein [Labilibacter sediminis]|nr:porin family protein [Labilibacter sediminis]
MSMYTKAIFRLKILVLFLLVSMSVSAQDGLLIGGGVSYQIPTNTFGTQDFGFASVANNGYGLNIGTSWFFNPRLSIGSELAYSYFPKDKKVWNQENKGDIKVNYQMMNLNAQGNLYFAEDEFRPYLGAVFGLYYLRNLVSFASNNAGTDGDASVDYISKSWHAGFGLESGMFIELAKASYLQLSLRYTMIPDIELEYFPEDDVTINPHGKQNHWSVSAKLFFGKK